MGAREAKIEKYLRDRVKELDGVAYKFTSPGRVGVHDQIIRLRRWAIGVVFLVEVKTLDGKLSSAQEREHIRMEEAGMYSATVYGEDGVDELLRRIEHDPANFQTTDSVTR